MMSSEQIRTAGLAVLQKRLGKAGMIRFLQMFSTGTGDYTKDRRAWVDSQSLDDMMVAIRAQQAVRRGKRRA